ncbi:ras guanyl-releasing protein 3 isoform X1 [Patella vulgata]|uniref:ras guanyl-releasing protein 3 isoform X1 n=1 Tax=Patella vulgata TaxID=6465 RepID=UPI0024A91F73|nr:ras guanyl-releasing protein 3 isoform X1 [Patella vulgata]XP_055956760.1 ras guanyl-releasing protein 3 isoform X1 [Patella vulgata]
MQVVAHRGVLCVMEEEKSVVVGVCLRAATPDRLIQICVDNFGPDELDEQREEYCRVFFLMHQWFMKSEELAQAFIDFYQGCDETITCDLPDCQHLPISDDCPVQQYKVKICRAVRYWIQRNPVHFAMDSPLRKATDRLGQLLLAEGNTKLKQLVDLSQVPSYDWMRNMSVRNPSNHNRKVSLVFNHLEPEELADQLTYLEYKAFRRIHFSDYKNYAVTASLKENPKLERSIGLFNGLSQWVQCMILSKTTPQQRADVITKFSNVSKRLRVLQNFNTLMAIVGGLTHSALARLSKTNACLPSETQKTLMEFTELLSSNNNFSNYRKVYHQCVDFKIPILGVHLKDLISLHTALPDRVEGNLINFRKMAQLSLMLQELTRLQRVDNIPVDANMDLVNTLRLSLDLNYTEDEIYELSLAREPRGSVSSPTTPTKPVMFADWISGVSPPDPNTINKHVHDMVEAVFKNYDHDKDRFISHAEFEAIAGNFPFIDSFYVLDADKDGMISKDEMKTYFIRANCHALRNSFKHAFHETTYFKPTFCIHCTGLLWGIIKQGWKCKECSINAHKHCKDLVVMECRKGMAAKRTDSMSNGSVSNDLTYSAKRKISQRHKQAQLLAQSSENKAGSNTSIQNNQNNQKDQVFQDDGPREGEFYEEQHLLYDRWLKSEEAREQLIAENSQLRARLEVANDQILILKSHIGVIRQNTIAFILEQMDALHMQRDSEV